MAKRKQRAASSPNSCRASGPQSTCDLREPTKPRSTTTANRSKPFSAAKPRTAFDASWENVIPAQQNFL